MYSYLMPYRPAGPGAQPKGGLSFIEDMNYPETGYYAKLHYDRELSEDELRSYELVPAIAPDPVGYRGFVIDYMPRQRMYAVYWENDFFAKRNNVVAYVDSVDEAKRDIDAFMDD